MHGQRKCFEEHYGDGVRDGSVSAVSFSKIRNGLGARNGGTGLWILTRTKVVVVGSVIESEGKLIVELQLNWG